MKCHVCLCDDDREAALLEELNRMCETKLKELDLKVSGDDELVVSVPEYDVTRACDVRKIGSSSKD